MADVVLFTQARVECFNDPDTNVTSIVIHDGLTQRDYRYDVPDHLVPTLADATASAIDARPDLYPVTSTRATGRGGRRDGA